MDSNPSPLQMEKLDLHKNFCLIKAVGSQFSLTENIHYSVDTVFVCILRLN